VLQQDKEKYEVGDIASIQVIVPINEDVIWSQVRLRCGRNQNVSVSGGCAVVGSKGSKPLFVQPFAMVENKDEGVLLVKDRVFEAKLSLPITQEAVGMVCVKPPIEMGVARSI